MSDVTGKNNKGWLYSEGVKDHFLNPKNFENLLDYEVNQLDLIR